VASNLVGQWKWTRARHVAEGQPLAAPGDLRLAITEAVTPEIFRTLRIPVVSGRALTAQDGPNSTPAVVLNASLARRLWRGKNPLAKRLGSGSN
jgi:hypothetical protein